MKKLLTLLLCSALILSTATAEAKAKKSASKDMVWSIGGVLSLPQGGLDDWIGMGIGIQGAVDFNRTQIEAAFVPYSGKDGGPDITVISLFCNYKTPV